VKLVEIEIKGYRSVRHESIKFDEDCIILLGKNETGKTSLLSAASLLPEGKFLAKDIHSKNEIDGQESTNYVRFIFEVEKSDIEDVILTEIEDRLGTEIYNRLKISDGTSEYTISDYILKFMPKGLIRFYPEKDPSYSYFLSNADLDVVKLLPDNIIHTEISDGLTEYILEEDLPEGVLSDDDSKFELAGLNTIIGGRFIHILNKSNFHSILWDYSENSSFTDSVIIDDFINNPPNYRAFYNIFAMAGYSDPKEDASKLIKNGNRNQRNRALTKLSKAVTSYLNSTWEDYKDIQITVEYDNPNLSILVSDKAEDSNQYTPEQRSFGFKKFMLFLLHIATEIETNNNSGKILLVDEPEIGLHPSAIVYFKNKLLELAKQQGVKVIYSTHSEHAIDTRNIERHYIVTKVEEETKLSKATESTYFEEQILLEALGTSAFRKITDDNLVFEGWTDFAVFNSAMNSKKRISGLQLIQRYFKRFGLAFVGGARDVRNFAPMVQLSRRNCFIITDSDQVSLEAKKSFEDGRYYGHWTTYADLISDSSYQTLEDFLELTLWKKAVKANLDSKKISLTGLDYSKPRCKNLKDHLTKNGMESGPKNKLLREVKDKIFDGDFDSKDLVPKYFDMLDMAKKWITTLDTET